MAHGFQSVERGQRFLLPPDVREWLPEDHLAWLVIEAVEQMDLSAFTAGYRLGGAGRQAYHPAMMVALLLYAYATGLRSSRQIERSCVTDVAFRVIAANQQPDHATIARFRVRHGAAVEGLFVQVLGLCVQAGLIDARVVAVDSTKIAANASAGANLTREQLHQRAREVLAEAAEVDAEEDARFGDRRGDEPAPGWQPGPGRAQRIRQALQELERHPDGREEIEQRQRQRTEEGKRRRGRKPLPADPDKPWRVASKTRKKQQRRANVTDPQSRTMRTPKGWQQGYSAQAVTDSSQVVLAGVVTNQQNDNDALKPMLHATRDNLVRAGHDTPTRLALADRGYWNTEEIDRIERDLDLTALVAVVRDRDQRSGRSRADTPSHTKMHRRFEHPSAKRLYRRRSSFIEPVFGQIKNRGTQRFLLRGLNNVNTEWNLICIAHNLGKLHTARAG